MSKAQTATTSTSVPTSVISSKDKKAALAVNSSVGEHPIAIISNGVHNKKHKDTDASDDDDKKSLDDVVNAILKEGESTKKKEVVSSVSSKPKPKTTSTSAVPMTDDANGTDNDDDDDNKKEDKPKKGTKRARAGGADKKDKEEKKTSSEKKTSEKKKEGGDKKSIIRLREYRSGEQAKDYPYSDILKALRDIRLVDEKVDASPAPQVEGVKTTKIDGCDIFEIENHPGVWVNLFEALTSKDSQVLSSVAALNVFEDQLTKPDPAVGMFLAKSGTSDDVYLHLTRFAAIHAEIKKNTDFLLREYHAVMDLNLSEERIRVGEIRRARLKAKDEEETKKRKAKAAAEEEEKKKSASATSTSTSASSSPDKRQKALAFARAVALKKGIAWCDECECRKEDCEHGMEPEPKKQKTTDASVSSDDTVVSAPATPASTTTTSSSSITAATTSTIDVTADTPKSSDKDEEDEADGVDDQ